MLLEIVDHFYYIFVDKISTGGIDQYKAVWWNLFQPSFSIGLFKKKHLF